MSTQILWTVDHVARALAISKRTAADLMNIATHSGTLDFQGHLRRGWIVEAMPSNIRRRLLKVAAERGLASVEDLLANPSRRAIRKLPRGTAKPHAPGPASGQSAPRPNAPSGQGSKAATRIGYYEFPPPPDCYGSKPVTPAPNTPRRTRR